ncbi:spermatogenesis-defective protein 39 homolog isoform X2 [Actinia tenebrosa]|uniref:Spermatogenesis-defective protein 39 homolog isoform X2 n=1 Tax=Actinia tenebrosa TaxID=6105 RepID=A0A6P8J258_ACTTE|nr:spermatogenesis-defective protein 39 homolog isoform X2 [Actinia tenebrosa]
MASRAKGFSFKELSINDYTDYDEEDTKKIPKRNPFDFGDDDVTFESAEFVSQSQVKDFFNVSRGITFDDDDNDSDVSLGQPWGGPQFSIEKSDPAKSARFRSASSASSQSSASSLPVQNDPGSFASVSSQRSSTTAAKKVTSGGSLPNSKTLSSSSKPSKSTSHTVSAAAVRGKTGTSTTNITKTTTTTTKSALNAVSSSISDVVASTPQVSVNEYYRLQTEVGQLRRDLQAAKQSRLKPLPVTESVTRIIRGQPYSLELHKSLKDKVNLLDCAIKMHDGNAIIAVILFLKKTVKKEIFCNQLIRQPKALHHYCKFLRQNSDLEELVQLYRRLGKHEDAIMVKFNNAVKMHNPSNRLFTLKEILKNDVPAYPISADCVTTIQEYIKLLNMQIDLEASDTRAEQEGSNITMTTIPRQATLPLLPVITTLYYCCIYHYGQPESTISSPLYLRNTFKLSEKQFEWTALAACAKTRRWKDIDDLLKGKGWFGTSKLRSLIGFGKVVTLLYHNKTPEEILSKYLRLIDDLNNRLSLAVKFKCHDVVIETLVAMKDRQKLNKYREQMPNYASQQQTITNYLRNSQIKWKN